MIDKVWMICNPDHGQQVWYSPPASNAQDAWKNASDWEQFMSGGQCIIGWIEEMKKEGWRAKRVTILEGNGIW